MERESSLVKVVQKHALSLVRLKKERLVLECCERIAQTVAVMSHVAVMLLIAFFASLFFFVAAALGFAILFRSFALGFLCVAVIYVIAGVVLWLCGDRFKRRIENLLLPLFVDKKYDEAEERKIEIDKQIVAEEKFFESPFKQSASEVSRPFAHILGRFLIALFVRKIFRFFRR